MTEMILFTKKVLSTCNLYIGGSVNKIGCIRLENNLMIEALEVKDLNMGS